MRVHTFSFAGCGARRPARTEPRPPSQHRSTASQARHGAADCTPLRPGFAAPRRPSPPCITKHHRRAPAAPLLHAAPLLPARPPPRVARGGHDALRHHGRLAVCVAPGSRDFSGFERNSLSSWLQPFCFSALFPLPFYLLREIYAFR